MEKKRRQGCAVLFAKEKNNKLHAFSRRHPRLRGWYFFSGTNGSQIGWHRWRKERKKEGNGEEVGH